MNKLQNTDNDQFVIAGDTDSVSKDSIITIDNKTIEELFNKYKDILPVIIKQNGTEYIDLNNDEYTYSQNGKTKIKTISRHKVSKLKWKITIDNNSIEMTNDHSIMVCRDGKIIECKPSEILETDYLLKRKENV